MADLHPLIAVSDADLADLRARLRATRWPTPWPLDAWEAGADSGELQRLARYWASDYDWRAHEAELNDLPSETTDVDGTLVHYLRFDGEHPESLPIVLTHGWPSSFIELVPLAQRLATPSQHGGDASDAFTALAARLHIDASAPVAAADAADPRDLASAHARESRL